ncbi:hypothetical protein FB192DRAFT_1456575 [Mucor lusitanicus]|uniref:Uncharacterized protein n=1 Tax=Mucor circinelloides f. lusitanicus TaxID=29924 RepID=A0A8H4BJR1_MUCCL|nr:hypothetical protein FB192DRAFT_1456575 [Mucor lusitanicus]
MKHLNTVVNTIRSYHPKDMHEKIADYQYKFWSFIFEQYLGRKQDVMLRWGDTISESCKKIGKKFKLDLRLVLSPEDDIDFDNCTGEMTKKATVKKVYKDKLKSTITTKCHLNSFIRAVSHIQARELSSIASFLFPQSLKQIRGGDIESLINSLAAIEEMVDNLRKVYHDCTSSTSNDISSILSHISRQSKPTQINPWLTKVVFENQDDDSSSNEEDDDKEEDESNNDDNEDEKEQEENQEEDDDDDEEVEEQEESKEEEDESDDSEDEDEEEEEENQEEDDDDQEEEEVESDD